MSSPSVSASGMVRSMVPSLFHRGMASPVSACPPMSPSPPVASVLPSVGGEWGADLWGDNTSVGLSAPSSSSSANGFWLLRLAPVDWRRYRLLRGTSRATVLRRMGLRPGSLMRRCVRGERMGVPARVTQRTMLAQTTPPIPQVSRRCGVFPRNRLTITIIAILDPNPICGPVYFAVSVSVPICLFVCVFVCICSSDCLPAISCVLAPVCKIIHHRPGAVLMVSEVSLKLSSSAENGLSSFPDTFRDGGVLFAPTRLGRLPIDPDRRASISPKGEAAAAVGGDAIGDNARAGSVGVSVSSRRAPPPRAAHLASVMTWLGNTASTACTRATMSLNVGRSFESYRQHDSKTSYRGCGQPSGFCSRTPRWISAMYFFTASV
eukprot:m.84803 g.84803  ORF g.84803 m.84803 type:complete len:378 (-) comp16355_c0_seq3:2424-3557(-)